MSLSKQVLMLINDIRLLKIDNEKKFKDMKILFIGLVALIIVSLCGSFAAYYLLSKDTFVDKDDNLVSWSGKEIKVANTEHYINDSGELTIRSSHSSQKRK